MLSSTNNSATGGFWRRLATSGGRRAVLATLVTAAFLLALVLNPAFDLRRLGTALVSADYLLVVPAVLIFFAGIWIRALRWRLLLMPIAEVPASRLFQVLVIGFMANNVLPVRAGELVRAHELAEREGISRTSSLGTIVVERVFDGLTLLGILGFVVLSARLDERFLVVLSAGAVVFVGLFAAIVGLALGGPASETLLLKLTRPLPDRLGRRIGTLTSLFLTGLASVRRPATFALVLATSAAAWLVESAVYYLVIQAFRISVPGYVGLLVTSVANLAITVPSSQGGIGPFEFFAAQTLTAFSVSEGTAAAYAIVAHATVLLPVIPLGVWLVWRNDRRAPSSQDDSTETSIL